MLRIALSPTITVFCLPVAETTEENSSRRTRERAAVAEIVARVFGQAARIGHYPDGAPLIEGREENISVSHSTRTAALAVSTGKAPIGIDIELYRSQLDRVAPRVFSPDELPYYSESEHRLLTGWTLKEAIYKAARTPGLDFRRDIRLGIPATSPSFTPDTLYLPYFHRLPWGELITVVEKCDSVSDI